MDYEKKYKEALEKARQFSEKPYLEDSKGIVEYIFPELAGSEDEEVRKMLMAAVKQTVWLDSDKNKCYAWLEKQGKQKSLDDIAKEVTKDKDAAISFFKSAGIINENGELADEYKIEQGEQKPTWSEEDELHIRELESLVKQVWAKAEHENDKETIHKMSDLSFFLKTLKPQLKQEWSEEDNDMLDKVIHRIEQLDHYWNKPTDEKMINWLKSLKPQNTWKPSEEQINALDNARHSNPFNIHILDTLFHDLNKLK